MKSSPARDERSRGALPAVRVEREAGTSPSRPGMAREDSQDPPHLAIIVTSGLITTFFRGQIARLRQAGFRVTFICALEAEAASHALEGAEVIVVSMEREIAPFSDLLSLWRLWRTLRRIKPDITSVGTPKAGLLGGIAARLSGVRCRIYTIHGLRLETFGGWKRRLLVLAERLACANAQYVRCVGPSLRQKAIELGLVSSKKAYIVGSGSSNGTDYQRFRRSPENLSIAKELRRRLGVPDSAPVIGFVGRLVRDKGINELCHAYQGLKQPFPELHLLLVGDFEEGDPIESTIRARLMSDPNVHVTGIVPDPAPYYLLMNVLALPTYREGFPNTPREAAAAGIPTITTSATGAADSVVNGTTGLIVPPRDAPALAVALQELLQNPGLCRRMGLAGEEWVRTRFAQELVWQGLIADYKKVLAESSRSGIAGRFIALLDPWAAALLLLVVSPVMAAVGLLALLQTGGSPD